MDGPLAHPAQRQEGGGPALPVQAGFRQDRELGRVGYHTERPGHVGASGFRRVHRGPRSRRSEGTGRRALGQHHERPGVVLPREGQGKGGGSDADGRVHGDLRVAVGIRQVQDGGFVGGAPRYRQRGRREVRDPRGRQRERVHRIPAPEVLGGPDGGGLPRPVRADDPSVSGILQMAKGRLRCERRRPHGHPWDPGMAPREEHRSFREMLPGHSTRRHTQRLSVCYR